MKNVVAPRLAVNRILSVFGQSDSEISAQFAFYGIQRSVKTIQKWRTRNSIPMPRFLEMIAIAKRMRLTDFTLERFLNRS